MKATHQYFSVVVLIIPYKVVLTSVQNVDKSLECSYLNESFWQWAPVVLFIMLNVVVNDFSSAIYKIFEISY